MNMTTVKNHHYFEKFVLLTLIVSVIAAIFTVMMLSMCKISITPAHIMIGVITIINAYNALNLALRFLKKRYED